MLHGKPRMINKNALFSLAYLKNEVDLLYAVGQLLFFSIKQSRADEYDLSTITKEIKKFCELEFPIAIIKLCLKKLQQEKYITYVKENKTYRLSNQKAFDDNLFDSRKNQYDTAESYVFQEFRAFLSKICKRQFTNNEIRNGIAEFLINGDNAVSVFLDNRVLCPHNSPNEISASWYFAYFIDKSSEDGELIKYLHDLSYGYAMCVSLFGAPDDSDMIPNVKIDNTEFFLDTKLALRFLGYSFSSEVLGAQELVSYIKSAKGRVCIFPKNIHEIGNALHNAAIACKKQRFLSMDQEMCFYASDKANAEKLIEMFGNSPNIDNLEELFRGKGVSIGSSYDPHWSDVTWDKHNIDVNKLSEYIRTHHPSWKTESIDNDVAVINYINRFRQGNYSNYFGGKRKSPVFITTNYPLIYDIKSYAEEDSDVNWKNMRLPIISDLLLTYSLWLKMGKVNLNAKNAISSRVLYSLNHQSENFRSRILDKAKQLEKTSPDEMPFIYETAHWDTMQHTVYSVIIATDGNLSNLTDQILINSEQEAIRLHTIEMENEKSSLTKEISILREANDAAEAREIRHLAKIFEFNISELRFCILAHNYGYYFLLFGYFLCLLFGNIFSYFTDSLLYAIGFSILLSTVLILFDVYKFHSKSMIKKYFHKMINKKIDKHIANIIDCVSQETPNCNDVVGHIKNVARNQINSKLK